MIYAAIGARKSKGVVNILYTDRTGRGKGGGKPNEDASHITHVSTAQTSLQTCFRGSSCTCACR